MNVISAPNTIQIRRQRLLGLIAAIAAAAAGVTYGVSAAFDTNSSNSAQQTLSISPDDRAFSRAASAAVAGVALSPDDRSFSRATKTAPVSLPADDRAFFRGTSFKSSEGPASLTPKVQPGVRAIRALTPSELSARGASRVGTLAQVQRHFFSPSGPKGSQRW